MVDHPLFIPLATAAAMLTLALAEWLHARRARRLSYLAFGPTGRPRTWTSMAAPLRVLAGGAACWGMLVLLALGESQWDGGSPGEDEVPIHHVVIALDVSPSMQIDDSGMTGSQTRADRAREVLRSVLERLDMRRGQVSVIAFYTVARPVVVDTYDPAVVHNILNDLPLGQAFEAGQTNLYSVVTSAEELAERWRPGSASLLIVSDGDTLPAEELPKRSRAFDRILVLGVGDPFRGTFIDDHSSRQDRRSLAQLAAQMRGEYVDVNTHHLASDMLPSGPLKRDTGEWLAWREVALVAVGAGSSMLALLPLALALWGGIWNPRRAGDSYLTREHFDRELSVGNSPSIQR